MARIHEIKGNDAVNGEGICVSVWFQGCEHYCDGCFNYELWDFNKGEELTNQHVRDIIKLLDNDDVKRNLSLLGGEPLCPQNIDDSIYICEVVKSIRPNTKIYAWSGYTFEQLINMYGFEKLEIFDVLIDGKFEKDKFDLNLKMRGSTNQRIIDVKESLYENKVILYNDVDV